MEEKSLPRDPRAGETQAPGCKDGSGRTALHATGFPAKLDSSERIRLTS